MKTVKYLFLCVMNTLSYNVLYIKDFIFGVLQILLYFAVLFVSYRVLYKYGGFSDKMSVVYGVLIMIGFILALYTVICLVECTIRLILKLKNK